MQQIQCVPTAETDGLITCCYHMPDLM